MISLSVIISIHFSNYQRYFGVPLSHLKMNIKWVNNSSRVWIISLRKLGVDQNEEFLKVFTYRGKVF